MRIRSCFAPGFRQQPATAKHRRIGIRKRRQQKRSSGPAGPSLITSMKHGLVGLVLIRKVDGLVLARREIDVAQHLAAARALAFDMDHKGSALALLAQNSAQAEHRVDVARAASATRLSTLPATLITFSLFTRKHRGSLLVECPIPLVECKEGNPHL